MRDLGALAGHARHSRRHGGSLAHRRPKRLLSSQPSRPRLPVVDELSAATGCTGAGGTGLELLLNKPENKLPVQPPGRLATGTPSCAPRMKRLQISTGRLPPVPCLGGVPSSLRGKTPGTRCAG